MEKNNLPTVDEYKNMIITVLEKKSYSHKPHLASLPGNHQKKDKELSEKRLKEVKNNIQNLEKEYLENDYYSWELDNPIKDTERAINHLKNFSEDNDSITHNSIDYLEKRLAKMKTLKKDLEKKERIINDFYDDYFKTLNDLELDGNEDNLFGSDGLRPFMNIKGQSFVSSEKCFVKTENGIMFAKKGDNGTLKGGSSHTINKDGTLNHHKDGRKPLNYRWYESKHQYSLHKGFATYFLGTRIPIRHTINMGESSTDEYMTLPDYTLRPYMDGDGNRDVCNHKFKYNGKNVHVNFRGSGNGYLAERYYLNM